MKKFSRWDDYLVAEHELIERSMEVLKNALENLEHALKNPLQIKRAIDFLLEFGDKMHNKKEENFLFPLMGERGIPVEGGPLGVMMNEHKMERELLSAMNRDLSGLADSNLNKREIFKAKGLEYLAIRAEHIWKENDILYAMGRKVFTEEDNVHLLAEFNRLDTETYGPEAHTKFIRMVEEVEKASEEKKRLIRGLSYEQLDAIMETLPFELTFVDAQDTVAYFNRLDKEKLFPRTRSVIGRKVEKCHPEKSVDMVNAIVEGFKNRTRDKAEFWINFRGDKVLIRYFPVYNDSDEYMGVLEITQAVGWLQTLEGEKRLLD